MLPPAGMLPRKEKHKGRGFILDKEGIVFGFALIGRICQGYL